MKRGIEVARNIQKTTDRRVFFLTFTRGDAQNMVIDLNTDGQLRLGITSDGSALPVYSRATEIISGGEKIAGTPFTLYDTGAFYDSFKMSDVSGDFVTISADTVKPNKDLLEYGDLLGLTEGNLSKLVDYIIPIVRGIVRQEALK
jgi:hypothetical protein